MTRLYSLPPQYQDAPSEPTLRQQEIQAIRRHLSGIAAKLTQRPERVEWAVTRLEVELRRLEQLRDGKGVK